MVARRNFALGEGHKRLAMQRPGRESCCRASRWGIRGQLLAFAQRSGDSRSPARGSFHGLLPTGRRFRKGPQEGNPVVDPSSPKLAVLGALAWWRARARHRERRPGDPRLRAGRQARPQLLERRAAQGPRQHAVGLDEYSDCRDVIASAIKGGSNRGTGAGSPGIGATDPAGEAAGRRERRRRPGRDHRRQGDPRAGRRRHEPRARQQRLLQPRRRGERGAAAAAARPAPALRARAGERHRLASRARAGAGAHPVLSKIQACVSRFFGTSAGVAASAVPLILGAALAGVAFGAEGGTELTRTTIAGVLLVAGRRRRHRRRVPLGAPGRGPRDDDAAPVHALRPAHGDLGAVVDRPRAHLRRGGPHLRLPGRLRGRRRRRAARAARGAAAARGLLIAATSVVYSLASRVWPGALAENEVSNRLGQPFDYWNAVGCVAAMAVPIALWLGSRRSGSPTPRVIAYPVMGAFILAIILTQSRGAAAAAAVGAVAWFVLVPLRLRSLPVLLAPLARRVAVGAWALSKDPFTKTLQPMSAKESVAGDFGGLVLLMLVLLLLVGAAVETGSARRVPSARVRAGGHRRGRGRVPRPARGIHVGRLQRARHRRPHRRAHQRDEGLARGERRPCVRRLVLAREVLARGRPGLRRAPVRGRRRRRLRGRRGCATAPTPRSPATRTAGSRRRWPTSA